MTDGCTTKEGERFYLGDTRKIFDCWVTVDEYLWHLNNPWHLVVEAPWGSCDVWAGGAGGATCGNDDFSERIIFWSSDDRGDEWVEFDVERCSPPCYVRGFAYDQDGNPVSGASVDIAGTAYLTDDKGYTEYVECVCESGLHTATITPPENYTCFNGKCSVDYLCVEGYSDLKFALVYTAPPAELALSGIEIISRYGSKFYLQGEIQNIVADDEICLMYSRPGSADLLNLPSQIVGYTYMKGTSGTYDLQVGGKYLEFLASGYYIFELWRVSGTCETRTEKVAEYILKLEAPKYQYQLYFDLDAPEIAAHRHLLQGEYDKYNAAKPWTVVSEGKDCFSRIEPSALYSGSGVFDAWLCQAGEFIASGCSPLPWWVCPDLTDWDIYMRGECSCSDFKDNLQPLGIPCMHLIAAREHYGNEPPYCPYVQCS